MPVLPYCVPSYALAEITSKHSRAARTKANFKVFLVIFIFFSSVFQNISKHILPLRNTKVNICAAIEKRVPAGLRFVHWLCSIYAWLIWTCGQNKKPLKLLHFNGLKLVGRDGFEPSKSLTADLQSAPFGHSGTYPCMKFWSWWTDSNPRPADYKSAALPTELHQHTGVSSTLE